MRDRQELLAAIQAEVRSGRHRVTLHAISRAGAHNVALDEVEVAILSTAAAVIEDYPSDPRGASCLLYGMMPGGAILHVVCSHPPQVAIITCYRPTALMWDTEMKARSKSNDESVSGL